MGTSKGRGTGRIFTSAVERAVNSILAQEGISRLAPIFLNAPLDVDQTTGLSGHVEWRDSGDVENGGWQTSGQISVSTGAGQLAGIVTLPEGRKWLVQAHLAASFSSSTGLLGCQWGITPSPLDPFGQRTNIRPLSQAIDERGVEICSAIFDATAGAIDVNCQILNATNLSAILRWNLGGSFALIRSL